MFVISGTLSQEIPESKEICKNLFIRPDTSCFTLPLLLVLSLQNMIDCICCSTNYESYHTFFLTFVLRLVFFFMGLSEKGFCTQYFINFRRRNYVPDSVSFRLKVYRCSRFFQTQVSTLTEQTVNGTPQRVLDNRVLVLVD